MLNWRSRRRKKFNFDNEALVVGEKNENFSFDISHLKLCLERLIF